MYMFVHLVVLSVVVLAASGAPQAGTTCDSYCQQNGAFVCCTGAKPTVKREGSTCQFPFIYKGVSYSSCTTKDDPDGQLWCSTQTDSSNNHQKGKFKHCHESASSACQFPFIYSGVTYTACTTEDDPDGKPWCSIQTDNRNNHVKGKWSHCQDSGGTSQSGTGSSNLLPETCGAAIEGDRIVGGTELPMQSFVWIALIGLQNPQVSGPSWDCGGSLISQRYVVTAAHCSEPAYPIIRVRLGEHDLSKTQDCQFLNNRQVCAPPVQDFNPEQIIPHPSYNTRSTFSDDILLIRLDRPAEFNSYVQPICLAPLNLNVGEFLNGREAEVAGWGFIDMKNEKKSDVKRMVKVPFEKMEKCMGIGYEFIHGGQLCFGGKTGKDSCRGDSGGPLVSTDVGAVIPNSYVLLGAVSFGPDPCGQARPAVYTDVGHYRNWIESNLRP